MISLRRAVAADCHDILCWRNDSLSRAMSRCGNFIPAKTHERWLRNALRCSDRVLYIGMLDASASAQIAIGIVRFDVDAAMGQAEISINLNPEVRGRGLAAPLLNAAVAKFHATHSHVIVAAIKQNNLRSLNAFLRAGFIETERASGMITLRR